MNYECLCESLKEILLNRRHYCPPEPQEYMSPLPSLINKFKINHQAISIRGAKSKFEIS
jgi:hypothetical protein